ncbi:MBL fold metallo-hydrolase [Desertihabitans aurantiacus]|uniref:hydrolase n=1 Tax=Desertihabitans aurantiacus TaxID=2282477 RepID=UPI000DF84E8C|nr:hydrolase [Desertihabitans aurantiacus]
MPAWICATCAVEHPPSPAPPDRCPICSDERQYVPPAGQRWTTLAELSAAGHRGRVRELEPGLLGVTVEPEVGIGQQALLATGPGGNVLWDPTGYVDDELAAAVAEHGPVVGIAASHPHMFGVQVEWSRRLGGVPVHVNARDARWLQRTDPAVRLWEDRLEVAGVLLVRVGGHFPGSAVAHWAAPDGVGVLLSGDTVAPNPDRRSVGFMRSYPNHLPLSDRVVATIQTRIAALHEERPFERIYGNFDGRVDRDAATVVHDSAERYRAWVRGDHDHLTGTVDDVR